MKTKAWKVGQRLIGYILGGGEFVFVVSRYGKIFEVRTRQTDEALARVEYLLFCVDPVQYLRTFNAELTIKCGAPDACAPTEGLIDAA